MVITPGTRLGPYEIVSTLGRGGMGEVYRARDTRLGRDVAVKVLPDAFATDPDRVRRFEQEARAIAALNHPHICQIHDVGPNYLVLEYVDGTPVRGPLAAADVLRLAHQIATALEAAHGRGILHRDIKPTNILLAGNTGGREPTVKLLDFGLARAMHATEDVTRTTDGVVVGTAAYMSPEQAQGLSVDARSDVFALGAVIYELLSGDRAFPGMSSAETLSAVLRDDPRPLPPSPLAAIVGRCLAKDPARRYQTMAAVREALEQAARAPQTAQAQASIAVLPFVNLSPDPDNEYFSDGLAEEIINALTRIPGLKVIARTSAFAFKGKNEDVRRIAEILGVTTVLEGSVRKAANRIRVTAQLIAASDGSHVWSERYDRELADVFAVQDDIASSITAALQPALSAGPGVRRHTPEVAAYEQYLKGIYYWRRWTPEGLAVGRSHLERAIELDPQFAVAHAELSNLFHYAGILAIMPPRDALPLMRGAAQRALAIDPDLAEAHAMLGAAAAMFEYDWDDAQRQFRLAMAQPAVSPAVHRMYAHYCLLPLGRVDEAVAHETMAIGEDPLNLQWRTERAIALRAASRRDECDAELREVITLDPRYWFPYFMLGVNLALDGNPDDASAIARQAYELAPWFKPLVGLQAAMLKRAGETARADELIAFLLSDEGSIDPIGAAMFYLVSGDLEKSADWVERAIEERQAAVAFFLRGHATALQHTRRWPAIARLMKLPHA